MKALLEALIKDKGADASKDAEAPESAAPAGDDQKAVMKEAAKDGDWDAFVDALCSYVGK